MAAKGYPRWKYSGPLTVFPCQPNLPPYSRPDSNRLKRLVCEQTVVQLLRRLGRWGSLQAGSFVLDIKEEWGEKISLVGEK